MSESPSEGAGQPGSTSPTPWDPSRAQQLRSCADEFRALASRQGIPEVIETPGDSLPQSTTGHVVYDLGVAVSLALGDLAEALDVEADRATGR